MPRQPRTRLPKQETPEHHEEVSLESLQQELHNLREQYKRVVDRLERVEMRLGYNDEPLPMEGAFLLGWFRRLEEARCPLEITECLWLSQSLLRLRLPHVVLLHTLGVEKDTLARVCRQVLSYMTKQSTEHAFLEHPVFRSVGLWIHSAECWIRVLFGKSPELSFAEFTRSLHEVESLWMGTSPYVPVLRTKK